MEYSLDTRIPWREIEGAFQKFRLESKWNISFPENSLRNCGPCFEIILSFWLHAVRRFCTICSFPPFSVPHQGKIIARN